MSSPHLEPRQLETLDKLVSIPSPSGQEQEILRFIEERLSGVGECRITKQRVDEERWNLIVQKGAQEGFTIMLYAHVDSVLRRSSWENDYRFDISADRQRARGVKVYDMGAGVMILMEIMQTVNVPDGIRVVSVFGVGEEAKSEGASELMKWEGMKHVDLILSPEIATLDREERDNPKDVVIARCGILKTWMHINVPG
ncbi:M20/M25/M40 family metallo-hydrolase, partial [Patescibacteria group bacterium]|nr:M20/M25/M40 family metallo-hydrolase [Patescibacteria group bacterium]